MTLYVSLHEYRKPWPLPCMRKARSCCVLPGAVSNQAVGALLFWIATLRKLGCCIAVVSSNEAY